MRTSPKLWANIYFVLGIMFVYVAINSAAESGWNITTILFALFASLDFGVGIRIMRNHIRSKKDKKE